VSQFFEDIRIGEQVALGSHVFMPDEIVRFAKRFDPQPFHLSEEGGRASHFGGLVASGWHTAAVFIRLRVEQLNRQRGAEPPPPGERAPRYGPSPGFRDLKWLKPVHAGDTIAYSSRVVEKVELASRPNWGLVSSRAEAVNQRGETVMTLLGQVFVERRRA
jgi:acyl dehydratase